MNEKMSRIRKSLPAGSASPQSTFRKLGTARPQADQLGISEQIGAPEVIQRPGCELGWLTQLPSGLVSDSSLRFPAMDQIVLGR